ncbi:MAG: TIGR03905 family TSCPD domain-containing protein [Erysipelotrichaceae bacterium]|nr:TIGR03905 family TSCPD domain-containing protein [Erysipelotrichaceae bacterium]
MTEKFTYAPKGVCSRLMEFEMDGDTIVSLKVTGGCNGNLNGISKIVVGMKADDVIKAFADTRCNTKSTSCPDQIAQGLKAYLAK